MRIVHVVTLVSDDGAFGGPLRVALNQVAELRLRGHDAFVVAGHRSDKPPPRSVDGVPVTLFPVTQALPGGFSGLIAPGMLRWLARELPRIDVLHVHAGRDLITLPAIALARGKRRPVVVQTHGMVAPDLRPAARLFDLLFTRRLLTSAHERLVLTSREERELAEVLRSGSTFRLANGVPEPVKLTKPQPSSLDVLFLARLHVRKRPLAFVESAKALRGRHPHARWSLVGPDEGELLAVLTAINEGNLADVVSYEGSLPYEQVGARMREASVYVLPSLDEPFPMSLLEALRAGVPSICTTSCGIAPDLQKRGAAIVVEEDLPSLIQALDLVLSDGHLRGELAAAAQATVLELFSIAAVVDQLEDVYIRASHNRAGVTTR